MSTHNTIQLWSIDYNRAVLHNILHSSNTTGTHHHHGPDDAILIHDHSGLAIHNHYLDGQHNAEASISYGPAKHDHNE